MHYPPPQMFSEKQHKTWALKAFLSQPLILWSKNAYQNMNYYLEISLVVSESPGRPANLNG